VRASTGGSRRCTGRSTTGHGRGPHERPGRPSRDWLAHVQTARARHKIASGQQEEHERSLALGREILGREVQRRRLEPPDDARLAQGAATLSVGSGEQLQAASAAATCPSVR